MHVGVAPNFALPRVSQHLKATVESGRSVSQKDHSIQARQIELLAVPGLA